jgi:hypothetical protein
MGTLGVMLLVSLFAVGSGSSNSKTQTPPGSQVTLKVTGTSGGLKPYRARNHNHQLNNHNSLSKGGLGYDLCSTSFISGIALRA